MGFFNFFKRNISEQEFQEQQKMKYGLEKTRTGFFQNIVNTLTHAQIDDDLYDTLEEQLILADVGPMCAVRLVDELRDAVEEKHLKNGQQALDELRQIICQELTPRYPMELDGKPAVILVIGVNGVGKTTTIAKLAHRARMQGKKVMIAAADTFRAAAIEQLQVWAERVGALFHARPAGSDPASVAYEAMDRALAEKVDILFVDTAGRLQTKVNLMEELTKIRQVLGKKHEGAPHRCVLVIDATTGQNALSQAKLFKEAAGVDELILTKLDGTAKGGVAIAVAMQEKLPITYVGLGEKLEDLRPFNGADYARALLGDLDQGK